MSDEQPDIDDGAYRRSLEEALDSLGIGVLMSRDGRVVYASSGQLELIGYSMEELEGLTPVDLVAEDQREEIQARLSRRMEGESLGVSRYDVLAMHSSGRVINLNVVNAPLSGPGVNLLTLVRDVTDQRALERHSEQAHRMEALGHLCAGIAHDFNNYLTAVRLLGEALAAADAPEEREALFAELEKVTEGAARLTRQLQTFSAAEPERRVVLDLNIVVFEMAEMLRRITGRQIELALNLEPGLPPTQMNAAQLQQVVVNLVLNASQAMPNGGRVTVRTSTADAKVLLEVTDDGHGMAADVLERAFEPLFTTHPESRSGMGLSIVYGIARQCGGEVTIESTPDEGTRVCLHLPDAKGPLGRRRSYGRTSIADGAELRVLVVESTDEPIGGLVESGLGRAGFAVERCGLGEAQRRTLDYAALVLGTPPPAEADGLVERYLSEHTTGRVVFISTPPTLNEDVWESGRLTHVPKPFSVSELVTALRGDASE